MSRETIEEYLARGGQIQRGRPAGFPKGHTQIVHVKPKHDSRGEIYAVGKTEIRRRSEDPVVDYSALPQALLDKLAEIDGL